ncbi:ribokinase [Cytobacillus sp. FJAT-54145]|uniref:Ribokinase n=1 Tax=Cytobacillus spartinae TaxID=3299023 RepID=A0ABW6KA92_9BACI
MGKVLVIGSLNMDIVQEVTRHPKIGETVRSQSTQFIPGGKGANQAIATAKTGSNVLMIGVIGRDSFGHRIKENLLKAKVNTDYLIEHEGQTGMATILVNRNGNNTIVLDPGVNLNLIPSEVHFVESILDNYEVVLLQNEIPWETNQHVLKLALKLNKKVFLNLAPGMKVKTEDLKNISLLNLNETETEILTGIEIKTITECEEALKELIRIGLSEVIITLGEKGSAYLNKEGKFIITPAFRVDVVDTTAAGDTFIGSFTSARLKGLNIHECLEFATAASALCVSRKGAQQSIPDLKEVEEFLNKHKTINRGNL